MIQIFICILLLLVKLLSTCAFLFFVKDCVQKFVALLLASHAVDGQEKNVYYQHSPYGISGDYHGATSKPERQFLLLLCTLSLLPFCAF